MTYVYDDVTYVYDDVTYVVCALSARVSEGVPINNTLSHVIVTYVDIVKVYMHMLGYVCYVGYSSDACNTHDVLLSRTSTLTHTHSRNHI